MDVAGRDGSSRKVIAPIYGTFGPDIDRAKTARLNASAGVERLGPVFIGGIMRAKVGDRIIVKGHHVGEPDRDGEILTVGPEDGPPFTVLWEDSGHEALFFPGTDAQVQHFSHDERDEA